MISVIIPTYLEAENMRSLIERLAVARAHCGEPLEVLVIDDGSADGTAVIARTLLDRVSLGRVIERQHTRDLSAAVREGARLAQGDLVAVMDADLSHPPELLPTLIGAIRSGSQLALASRYVRGGRIANWGWRRRLLSRLGNLLAWPLVRVTDATSGYFVTEKWRVVSLGPGHRGFKILLEVLVRSGVSQVQEIPYAFVDRARGTSKLSCRVVWLYGMQLVQLAWYRVRHPRIHGHADAAQGVHQCEGSDPSAMALQMAKGKGQE